MQSWILAFILILVAGPVGAVGGTETRVVPPIPGPDRAMTPAAPLDRPWPAAPADLAPVTPERYVPPIPGPTLAQVPPAGPALARVRPATRGPRAAGAIPPIPGIDQHVKPISPLDEPWDVTAEVDVRDLPPIPAPMLASLPGRTPAALPAKLAPSAGFDPQGTVHVVAKGDTLWDISNLYLGTPWIWPSIWQDNQAVENPHLIFPGDKIWVSATEMRKLTDAEAEALLAGPAAPEVPAAMAEDVLSVPMPEKPRERFYYVQNASLGLVGDEELRDLARVVGTTEEQVLLAQGDVVFVDRGEGEVAPGDQFTLFRVSQEVHDPSTHRSLGHHFEVVGWLEIVKVHGDTARAKVRQSYADFVPGVYLKPRIEDTVEIEVLDSPPGVEGQIADLLLHQKYRGNGDVVVLNRGSEDGVVPGSPLEVYRPVAGQWKDVWYGDRPDAEIPHEVVAELVVLSAQPHTAMAYVTRSSTELWYGDRFRTVAGPTRPYGSRGLVTLEQRIVRWVIAQGQRAADEVQRLAAQVPTPDVPETPEVLSRWNAPRLILENLDGYDPR